MDALVAHQHVLFGRMSRTIDNLKKLGKDNISKGAIQSKLAILDTNWEQFQRQDTQIVTTSTLEEQKGDYFTQNLFDEADNMYCSQKGQLLAMLEEIESTQGSQAASLHHAPGPAPRSSLPRVQLPTFSGLFTEWTRFKDLFISLVIDDDSWSDAERFHYLSASLTGEAAELIQRIPIAAANFHRAWELLMHRYENRRLLVSAQFDLLYKMKPCTSHSARELKTLLNVTCNVAAVLNNLGIVVDNTSYWIVHHVVQRLDQQTLTEWETSLGNSTEPPTFSALLEFLEAIIRTREALEIRQGTRGQTTSPSPARKVKSHHTATTTSTRSRCRLCQGDHILCFCEAFRAMSPSERVKLVTEKGWCKNCLGQHGITKCTSVKRCQRCSQKHHTMLHDAIMASPPPSSVATLHIVKGTTHAAETVPILLATALVHVVTPDRIITARALVDPCSEVTLVSESIVQQLRLPRIACSKVVVGAGAKYTGTTRGKVVMTLSPVSTSINRSCTVEALILPRLTSYKPRCSTFIPEWPHISGLTLADPDVTSATPVDLLLGADVYPQILLEGIRSGGRDVPIAQETIFGWILSGPIAERQSSFHEVVSHTCTIEPLNDIVRRFWEQEELVTSPPHWTSNETACEKGFRDHHQRLPDGRYVVRLPFLRPPQDLGDSHSIARRILLSTERRLHNNTVGLNAYHQFMAEYRDLGHMEAVPRAEERTDKPHFYLPHHGVLKVTGASTKLRVVFNGSRPSSSGKSLNDYLLSGPKLQLDLMDVLLRWRRHRVAFIADVEKMYRQIRVHPDDRDFQRILWRDDPDLPIQVFRLTTVTYGLSCAPFLALRTLQQLAADEGHRFPRGASVLQEDIYVDDILAGADSEEEARNTQEEIIGIFKAGGFTLKKWNSNCHTLLNHLPADFLASTTSLPWHPELGCSALGLTWHPSHDTLAFTLQQPSSSTSSPITKRSVLSQVAKYFDPLGWLAPFVIQGKIFIQRLWKEKLDWDPPLPPTLADDWSALISDAAALSSIRIPRWLGVDRSTTSQQLHIFVDASERAYAAAAYLRVDGPHAVNVTLVAAKTKTAPLKTISLPRLELCAALLGARLLCHIRREMKVTFDAVHVWSDSTVALAWLHGEPARWHTFVANRVSEFQTSAPDAHLHHVGSKDNPADCASRGISASTLVNHPLWWHGPEWLLHPPSTWDKAPPPLITTEEERPAAVNLHTAEAEPGHTDLLLRYSSLHRLLRITAWCLRWKHRPSINRRGTTTMSLLPEELDRAESRWIVRVQHAEFKSDLSSISRGTSLSKSSPLRPLAPFIDDAGILRVGGRLKNAALSRDEQHPIILPSNSSFTHLIIDQHHLRTLHGGVQLTLASTRQRFWIIRGRQQTKARIAQCLTCLRWRAAPSHQLMGNLPPFRVTPSRPFLHSGVDFAGPLKLKTTSGRGHKIYKGYVAIFVCFSTRAVHLEAVSDLSTPAFLAAFRRFTGRRGRCSTVTSDCGTNFVGADKELRRMFRASAKESAAIADELSKEGTQWKFNPPASPHFGGLWEAAVRSMKHHLLKVIGDNTTTYEELSTFLCQVEACLNSRPLQALTDDPEDLTPLTPGHFLIGAPLLAIPEPSLHDVPQNRLSRWNLLQQRVDHFWRRWSAEYLQHLQSRRKWTTVQDQMTVGDLVLIRSELTPPSKWPLARITSVHPGSDGHVRVVTLKTASNTIKRPVTKLIRMLRASDDTN